MPRGESDAAGESDPNLRIAERRKGRVPRNRSLQGQPPLTPVVSMDRRRTPRLFSTAVNRCC